MHPYHDISYWPILQRSFTQTHLDPLPDELAELPLDHVPPLHVEVLHHLGVEVAVHVTHHAVAHHLVCSGLEDLYIISYYSF